MQAQAAQEGAGNCAMFDYIGCRHCTRFIRSSSCSISFKTASEMRWMFLCFMKCQRSKFRTGCDIEPPYRPRPHRQWFAENVGGQDRLLRELLNVWTEYWSGPCKRCRTSRIEMVKKWSCLERPRQETLPPPPPPVPSALGPEGREAMMARMTRTPNHRFSTAVISIAHIFSSMPKMLKPQNVQIDPRFLALMPCWRFVQVFFETQVAVEADLAVVTEICQAEFAGSYRPHPERCDVSVGLALT